MPNTNLGDGGATGVRQPLSVRPLPLVVPTAFVRIRPRGARLCGELRKRHPRCLETGRGRAR